MRCDLKDADMSGMNIVASIFSETSLDGADMSGATIKSCKLLATSLNRTDFSNSILDSVILDGKTRLDDIISDGADIIGGNFRPALDYAFSRMRTGIILLEGETEYVPEPRAASPSTSRNRPSR